MLGDHATKQVMLAQSLTARLCSFFVHSHTMLLQHLDMVIIPLPGRSIGLASPQAIYVHNPSEYLMLPSLAMGHNNTMHMVIYVVGHHIPP